MTYKEYSSLISDNRDSICYIADLNTYEMYYLTESGMKLYGLKSPEDFLGQKCYKLLQGLDEPCPFCNNEKLKQGETCFWEHYNEKLGRWVEIVDTSRVIKGQLCRIEHAKDIHDRKMQCSRLSDLLSTEEILVDCVRILATEPDFNTAVNTFLEYIGRFYRANRAYIFEFNFDTQFIQNTYEWCAANISKEIDNLQSIPIEYISEWIRKFEECGEFFIPDLEAYNAPNSMAYKILEAQGIKSLLAAPLIKSGKVVGFLGVDDPSTNAQDLTLLRASSHFIMVELEKRRLLGHLQRASFTDLLTGLKNRNQYITRLKTYEQKPPKSLGVIFIDVNGMKRNNDTYGHKYGDQVLIRVADILKKCAPETTYRTGGDEFIIFYENIDQKTFKEKSSALRKTLQIDEDCNVSIGSVWKSGNLDVNAQIVQADEIMYAEKQAYYKKTLNSGFNIRAGIAEDIIRQIKDARFVVFFQPQVDIHTHRIIGAEALVRKKRSDGSLILPENFIPYYEIEGVIRHVDMFVFETVCSAIREWQEKHIPLRMSVNFSRVTLLEPGIVNTILNVCEKNNVSPCSITIEVTESISKMDRDELRSLVDDFRKAGFTISLDDFGSKYSNLSILTAIDFHEVKLDKSLIDDLIKNRRSQVVMKNVIQLCHELESTHSLAEGIETPEQLELLSEYGCEFGQGFLFSKPVPFEEFGKLLTQMPYYAS